MSTKRHNMNGDMKGGHEERLSLVGQPAAARQSSESSRFRMYFLNPVPGRGSEKSFFFLYGLIANSVH